MPHIKLNHLPAPADLVARFQPFKAHAEGDLYASYMAAYSRPDALLVETYIVEPSIQQQVALLATHNRENGQWVVALGSVGTPRATDGVHYAVRKLAEWLMTQAPGVEVVGDYTRTHFRDVDEPTNDSMEEA